MKPAPIGQRGINPRVSVVQCAARGCGEPLSTRTNLLLRIETHMRADQSMTTFHPDFRRAIDHDVSDVVVSQEVLQRTCAHEVVVDPLRQLTMA